MEVEAEFSVDEATVAASMSSLRYYLSKLTPGTKDYEVWHPRFSARLEEWESWLRRRGCPKD